MKFLTHLAVGIVVGGSSMWRTFWWGL